MENTENSNQRLLLILQADAATLAEVDRVLAGKGNSSPAQPTDRRLLTFSAVARELGISRATAHRMVADGRLPVTETRAGRRRIPSAAVSALVEGRVLDGRNRLRAYEQGGV